MSSSLAGVDEQRGRRRRQQQLPQHQRFHDVAAASIKAQSNTEAVPGLVLLPVAIVLFTILVCQGAIA